MRVFNVSSGDEMGGRWNGYDAIEPLKLKGINSKIGAFWNKTSSNLSSVQLFPGRGIRTIAEGVRIIEVLTGRQGTFQFWSDGILKLPEFLEADIVHLQVVHDHLLTVEAIRRIAMTKPTVWTWHDLWPLTGHCISPVGCGRWEVGCGNCPRLDAPLEVVWDRTKKERLRKTNAFSSAPINVHVSTTWMRQKVEEKVQDWDTKIFQFPFGVDTDVFKPANNSEARNFFGIDEGTFVVAARATEDPNKGFVQLVQALERVSRSGRPILLLTIQQQGLVIKYSKEVPSLEFPWTNNLRNLSLFYQAADLFVMPSLAETFGMMTLESMACGVPVITVSGTASSEVSSCGDLEVEPKNLVEGLAQKISWCYDNPRHLAKYGAESKARAQGEYSFGKYLSNLESMYRDVLLEK